MKKWVINMLFEHESVLVRRVHISAKEGFRAVESEPLKHKGWARNCPECSKQVHAAVKFICHRTQTNPTPLGFSLIENTVSLAAITILFF